MYHQCFKAVLKGKWIHINANESPFQRDDAHFLEATYFDELAEDGEAVPSKSRGAPLPRWEDLEKGEPRLATPHLSRLGQPRMGRQSNQRNKRTHREGDQPRKVRLVNGQTIYLL